MFSSNRNDNAATGLPPYLWANGFQNQLCTTGTYRRQQLPDIMADQHQNAFAGGSSVFLNNALALAEFMSSILSIPTARQPSSEDFLEKPFNPAHVVNTNKADFFQISQFVFIHCRPSFDRFQTFLRSVSIKSALNHFEIGDEELELISVGLLRLSGLVACVACRRKKDAFFIQRKRAKRESKPASLSRSFDARKSRRELCSLLEL